MRSSIWRASTSALTQFAVTSRMSSDSTSSRMARRAAREEARWVRSRERGSAGGGCGGRGGCGGCGRRLVVGGRGQGGASEGLRVDGALVWVAHGWRSAARFPSGRRHSGEGGGQERRF